MALLLETLGARDESKAIEAAVEAAIAQGQTTSDIGGSLGTREAGDFVAAHNNLANALASLNRTDEAIAACTRVVR